MVTGCCDLQRAARKLLAANLIHVRIADAACVVCGFGRRCIGAPAQDRRHLPQRACDEYVATGQRGLGSVGIGDDDGLSGRRSLDGRGQNARHRADVAVQRELTVELEVVEPLRPELTAGAENAECDGEVEAATGLAHVRRAQVRSDAFLREREMGTLDGAVHAVLALANGRLGQADDIEFRQPTRQEDLDRDRRCLDTDLRATPEHGEAHVSVPRSGC